MSPRCCSPKGLRKIRVGDCVAGVTGLDELLETMRRQGWIPEQPGLREALVAGLRAAGNYVSPGTESAYGEALAQLYREYTEAHQKTNLPAAAKHEGGIMKVEILGPGCARCRATEDNVRQALAELNLHADIIHITDVLEISRRRVMLTPGVIVDGEIKSTGRIPSIEDIKKWFASVTAP